MQLWRWLGVALVMTLGAARADTMADLIRSHIEAIGGRERITALKTMHVVGHVTTEGRTQKFDLLARRPNSIRVTTTAEGRTLIQGCDGTVAWRLQPDQSPQAHRMQGMEATDFMGEAEFDDQLVDPESRGYQLDYAGEVTYQGHKAYKVLVTTLRLKPYFLILDAETYFIVAQVARQTDASGQTLTKETRYSDFAPLDGVLLPRRFTVYLGERQQSETVLETMEANVVIKPGTFALPDTAR
ncbi:MAG: hypothetical protein JSS11_13545 [Verrucomicrobia bacterium]|nr:hypothetical protein [Verrucomicrobiota bacterium]